MDKIKELTDFYMWMQKNDYDHNIRARVERKAEMYLNNINVGKSEQLVTCKKCGSSEMYQYTKTKDKCEDCGNIQDY